MKIDLICPNASSNSLVRTYPIAKVLARQHQIRLLGFQARAEIFAPYRDEFDFETVVARKVPWFWQQIREVARKVHADAVYAFKPLPSSLWVGLLASRMHGIPLYLDIEDWEAGWYYEVPLADRLRHLAHIDRPNGFLWTQISETLARQADHTFVVSRFLQQKFGGTILPHGADTTVFDPARWPRREARARLGLDENGKYIVFTGLAMQNKGLDDLLTACSLFDSSDVRVVIVGAFDHDPQYRERLLAQFSDRLILVGARPHAEMPIFLAAADVVVLPQRVSRETAAQVPGKLFEAMAMARPIIATSVGDLPEILRECGIIVAPSAPAELALQLAHLFAHPDEAAQLGRNARLACEERYSWDAMEQILNRSMVMPLAAQTGSRTSA